MKQSFLEKIAPAWFIVRNQASGVYAGLVDLEPSNLAHGVSIICSEDPLPHWETHACDVTGCLSSSEVPFHLVKKPSIFVKTSGHFSDHRIS